MLRAPRTHFCEMSAITRAFVVANPRFLHVEKKCTSTTRRLGLHKSRHKTSNLITCKDYDTQVKRSYPRKLPDNRGARVLTNCNYHPARHTFVRPPCHITFATNLHYSRKDISSVLPNDNPSLFARKTVMRACFTRTFCANFIRRDNYYLVNVVNGLN